MTLSLKAHREYVFIDRTIKKLPEPKKLLDWETVNSMIVSWIIRSMDEKLVVFIPYHFEVKLLWDYLKKRFCVANGPRLQQLRVDITRCVQTKGMSVEDYLNKMTGLYDEYVILKPLHAYLCGLCTRNVAKKFVVDREEDIFYWD